MSSLSSRSLSMAAAGRQYMMVLYTTPEGRALLRTSVTSQTPQDFLKFNSLYQIPLLQSMLYTNSLQVYYHQNQFEIMSYCCTTFICIAMFCTVLLCALSCVLACTLSCQTRPRLVVKNSPMLYSGQNSVQSCYWYSNQENAKKN